MSTVRFPISLRLTLWYGLSLLLLLSLFGIFLYVGFHVGLHSELEREMRDVREVILPAVDIESAQPGLTFSRNLESLGIRTTGSTGPYVRLLAVSGDVLYVSSNFGDQVQFDAEIPGQVEEAVSSHVWEGVPTRSGYSPVFDATGAHRAWLEITRRESTIHNELHRLQWLLLAGGVLGIIVALAAGHWLAQRALRPVAMLTEAANQIQSGDLADRVPANFRVRDELSDLADTFNRMLDRIKAAFERERQFRADAAHELFTPLTGLQSEIDVALQKPRESEYYHESLLASRGHAQRMSAALDGLLELSHAENPTTSTLQSVDVGPFVLDCLGKFESSISAAGIELECEIASAAEVSIDPNHLEVVVENLLDNAIKYTPARGRIHVTVANGKDEVILKVCDTGIGFESSEQDKLFDRFYRSDARHVRDLRGSGLGLSIVKTLVERYGGRVAASSGGRDKGSTFEVRLQVDGG